MDAAGDFGTGIVAGLAADELGHVGQAERAEPDPAVAGQPAGRSQDPRQTRAGCGCAKLAFAYRNLESAVQIA
ncbi:hypothetical protein GCM10010176_104430 [Nonomuraea spiralis]|nr:hypothetical protein GCM10010176_104430 [Nonomuraea spiralis]